MVSVAPVVSVVGVVPVVDVVPVAGVVPVVSVVGVVDVAGAGVDDPPGLIAVQSNQMMTTATAPIIK